MQRQRGRTGLDELRPDLECGPRAVLDAAAHLHAHGHVHCLGHRFDDRGRAVGLVEERGARACLCHLAHGAAKVDVHEVGAGSLDHSGRLGHRSRLGTEDLHRERMLVAADSQITQRALVPVRETGATDHLRAHQSGPVAASLAAESLHAHTGHRGQYEPGRNLDRADRPGGVQIDTHGKGIVARRRTFSV
jgi:hypothetical protein